MRSAAKRQQNAPARRKAPVRLAEDAAAASPRHLIDDTQPLKVRQRSVDRRRRQKSAARACHIGRIAEVAGSLGLTADRRLGRAPV